MHRKIRVFCWFGGLTEFELRLWSIFWFFIWIFKISLCSTLHWSRSFYLVNHFRAVSGNWHIICDSLKWVPKIRVNLHYNDIFICSIYIVILRKYCSKISIYSHTGSSWSWSRSFYPANYFRAVSGNWHIICDGLK